MQHSALSEAQQLIQSWLLQSENVEGYEPSVYNHPAPGYGALPSWSGEWNGDPLGASHSFPHFTDQLHPNPLHLSPPPPPPHFTHPHTTTDWTHSLTSRPTTWTSAGVNPSSTNFSRKKSTKSVPNSESKRWAFPERWGKGGGGGEEGDEEEVGESVSSVMETLMRTPVVPVAGGDKRGRKKERGGHQDPRVVMDMRHKQVRERRKARDKERQQELHHRRQQNEVRQEAERLVREGEREEGRRRRGREETLVAEQMEIIRRQVQAETERKRRDRLVGVAHGKPHPSDEMLGISKREAVMVMAGECVRREEREKEKRERKEKMERERRERREERERRRRENRAELVKQMEEADLEERKDKSKVLRRVLSLWYDLVAGRRAKHRRAVAWWAWHLMERVWGVWRGYVRGRRERREQDRLAREIQREKRLISLAVSHYHHRLLSQCLGVWLLEVGRERGRREREREEARHRDKVQAFLRAAATTARSTVATGEGEGEGEREVEDEEREVGEEEREGEVEDEEEKEQSSSRCGRKKRNQMRDGGKEKRSHPVIWQKARKHVDELLSSVAPPTANEEVESPERDHTHQTVPVRPRVSTDIERGREKGKRDTPDGKPITLAPLPVWPPRLKSRQATKPIPMSGMEARSEAIAERKRKREEREREKEREREEQERREEEEKKEREQKEREAAAAKRREERRLARQREEERRERQKRERKQLTVSVDHYTRHLLRTRCLGPWLRFMEDLRRERKKATQFHTHWRLRCCLGKWREVVAKRERKREQTADELHHMMLRRRAWNHWREYMRECERLERLSEVWARELLTRAVFRGWARVTATARRLDWERERRAKIHHHRQLKERVLRRLRDYIPLAREEREREVRRAGLRRKVSQWLPDYQPLDFDQETTQLKPAFF